MSELELTKHFSLARQDPVALTELQRNGKCSVDVLETVFDVDYPGHYLRRLKTVAVSIPCPAGSYTTVGCTLTLTSNQVRKDATLLKGEYVRDLAIDDPRFRDEVAAIQAVAASSAQSDDGLFEVSFGDERYLPFEGAGAISSWHLELNTDPSLFDPTAIADVVLHITYTAREGGEAIASKATEEVNKMVNH